MRIMRSARSFLRRLLRNERGNFAMITALVAIPLMGIVGLGVDLTRAYIAQTRLQNAVDNAALAAAGMSGMCSSNTDTSTKCTKMKQIATNYFYSNYKADFWAPPAAPTLNIDSDGTMHVSATATSPNYFLEIFGYNNFTVASTADALGGSSGLEVVMVLDTTGSMSDCVNGARNCNASANKMAALKSAALSLVDTLYGGNATNSYLKIGIVPFTASVRLDPTTSAANGWIDTTGKSSVARLNFDSSLADNYAYAMYKNYMSGTSWPGCVEARPISGGVHLEETDDPPDSGKPDTLWVPFFSPDSPDTLTTVAAATTQNLSNLKGTLTIDGVRTSANQLVLVKDQTLGINNGIYTVKSGAWTRSGTAAQLNQAAVYVSNGNTNSGTQWNQTASVTILGTSIVTFTKITPANQNFANRFVTDTSNGTPLQHQKYSAKYQNQSPTIAFGMNATGPGRMCEASTITPLTSNKTTITNAINALTPDGYTHVAIGAAWGWRVLSPDAPYTEGAPYSDTTWKKAIILLTDGDNTMPTGGNPPADFNGSDYTAYGYAAQARMGPGINTTTAMETEQNNSLTRVCNNIKAVKRPDGSPAIHVYTVALGTDVNANLPLLQACATSTSDAYTATSVSALSEAFAEIGDSLSNIRLTK